MLLFMRQTSLDFMTFAFSVFSMPIGANLNCPMINSSQMVLVEEEEVVEEESKKEEQRMMKSPRRSPRLMETERNTQQPEKRPKVTTRRSPRLVNQKQSPLHSPISKLGRMKG